MARVLGFKPKVLWWCVSISLLVSGCGGMPAKRLRTLSPETPFYGKSASSWTISLSQEYSFKFGTGINRLPTGIYVPEMEDDDGVFFKAPTKIIVHTGAFDGGIFVSNQGTNFYSYIAHGFVEKRKLPNDFKGILSVPERSRQ